VLLLLALSWGGVRYPWGSAPVVALLMGSLALWLAFGWWLTRAGEPFIPLSMLREPLIALMITAAFFSIGTIIGLSIVVPLYLELVLGFPAIGGGIALIAYVVGTSLGSLSSGRLMARLARYKRVPLASLPLSIATFLWLAWQPAGWSLPGICAILMVNGFGVGTMYPFTTVSIQNAVEPHRFGIATGTVNFFRQLGGAIIAAAFVAIVLGGLEGGEGARLLATLTAHGASGAARSAGAAHFAPLFGWVFLSAALFLAASMLAVMLAEERPLRGPVTRVKPAE
jgi:sugar phosphate permease